MFTQKRTLKKRNEFHQYTAVERESSDKMLSENSTGEGNVVKFI